MVVLAKDKVSELCECHFCRSVIVTVFLHFFKFFFHLGVWDGTHPSHPHPRHHGSPQINGSLTGPAADMDTRLSLWQLQKGNRNTNWASLSVWEDKEIHHWQSWHKSISDSWKLSSHCCPRVPPDPLLTVCRWRIALDAVGLSLHTWLFFLFGGHFDGDWGGGGGGPSVTLLFIDCICSKNLIDPHFEINIIISEPPDDNGLWWPDDALSQVFGPGFNRPSILQGQRDTYF